MEIAHKERREVLFTIPVETTLGPLETKDGKAQMRITTRADLSKVKRFFRRLEKLCKKYGYTVGEIQEK